MVQATALSAQSINHESQRLDADSEMSGAEDTGRTQNGDRDGKVKGSKKQGRWTLQEKGLFIDGK